MWIKLFLSPLSISSFSWHLQFLFLLHISSWCSFTPKVQCPFLPTYFPHPKIRLSIQYFRLSQPTQQNGTNVNYLSKILSKHFIKKIKLLQKHNGQNFIPSFSVLVEAVNALILSFLPNRKKFTVLIHKLSNIFPFSVCLSSSKYIFWQ